MSLQDWMSMSGHVDFLIAAYSVFALALIVELWLLRGQRRRALQDLQEAHLAERFAEHGAPQGDRA